MRPPRGSLERCRTSFSAAARSARITCGPPPIFLLLTRKTGDWKPAQPSDETAKGKWWEVYGDPQLNSLEEQVTVSNQTLKEAQAQILEARAAVRIACAAIFPGCNRRRHRRLATRQSQNKALFGTTSPVTYSDFQLPLDVAYEPDVWGRVRRTVEAARSEEQATAADLASVDLSLHAELALDYFQLRGLDAEKQLLDSTVTSYEEALKLTNSRYNGGVASAVDVAQAQTQLESTRAEDEDIGVHRAAFEHAIAVLIGKPPEQFAQESSPLKTPPPAIPPELPSDLLERRPDIAAAERRVQEANAQIGVAKAAYFPPLRAHRRRRIRKLQVSPIFCQARPAFGRSQERPPS